MTWATWEVCLVAFFCIMVTGIIASHQEPEPTCWRLDSRGAWSCLRRGDGDVCWPTPEALATGAKTLGLSICGAVPP